MDVKLTYDEVTYSFDDWSELYNFINDNVEIDVDPQQVNLIYVSDDLPQTHCVETLLEVWEFLDDLGEQEREIALERYNDIGCDISDWDDDYLGVYVSWQDYIDQYVDECVLSEIPVRYQYYFDTESFGRDVRYEGFHSIYDLNSGDVAIYHN